MGTGATGPGCIERVWTRKLAPFVAVRCLANYPSRFACAESFRRCGGHAESGAPGGRRASPRPNRGRRSPTCWGAWRRAAGPPRARQPAARVPGEVHRRAAGASCFLRLSATDGPHSAGRCRGCAGARSRPVRQHHAGTRAQTGWRRGFADGFAATRRGPEQSVAVLLRAEISFADGGTRS